TLPQGAGPRLRRQSQADHRDGRARRLSADARHARRLPGRRTAGAAAMSYETLRHLADSWGLVFMGVTFLVLVGWTFRPKARDDHKRAANMIFDQDDHNG